MALSGTWKHIQRIVARPSSARVAVPIARRTALQSHIYRTGHAIPAEHRDPPSKKRKMEKCLHNQKLSSKTIESLSNQSTPRPDAQELETSEIKLVASFEDSCSSNARKQTLPTRPRCPQKLLLPKPEVPVFVPTAESSAQPVVLGVNHQGSVPPVLCTYCPCP